jgi:hypothetical protein
LKVKNSQLGRDGNQSTYIAGLRFPRPVLLILVLVLIRIFLRRGCVDCPGLKYTALCRNWVVLCINLIFIVGFDIGQRDSTAEQVFGTLTQVLQGVNAGAGRLPQLLSGVHGG